MVDVKIRPYNLPARLNPVAGEKVPSDNGSVVAGVTWTDGVNAGRPFASQGQAEAGVDATTGMSPLTTKQAIDAQVPGLVAAAQAIYDNVSVVASSAISGSISAIRTNGYYAAGDGGGALYKRVVSEPSHAGKIQSSGGAWWEIVCDEINVRQFGAKGDGATNDTAVLQACLDYSKSSGLPVYAPRGVYLSDQLQFIVSGGPYSRGLRLRGEGSDVTIFDTTVSGRTITSAFSVTSLSSIVTVNAVAHGYSAGDVVSFQNLSTHNIGGSDMDGWWEVQGINGPDEFIFYHWNPASSDVSDTGTATIQKPFLKVDGEQTLDFHHGGELRGFTIKSTANNTGWSGIYLRQAYKYQIEDVLITGCQGSGITIPCVNGDLDASNQVTFHNMRINNCAVWGIDISSWASVVSSVVTGFNEISGIKIDQSFIQGCGSTSYDGYSGGFRWKGQALTIGSLFIVEGQSCAVKIPYVPGTPSTVTFETLVLENNKGKQFDIEQLTSLHGQVLQLYNNDGFVATKGLYVNGIGLCRNIVIEEVVVRATSGNNAYTAFTATGVNAEKQNIRIGRVDWQNFDHAGQVKSDGLTYGNAKFSANKNGTNQTGITSATWTKVTFDTEDWDEGSHYDTTNSRWTPPPGKVRIAAAVYVSVGVVDQAQSILAVYKNGSAYRYVAIANASGTNGFVLNGAVIDSANGADYYEIYINSAGAGDKTVSGSQAYTFFQGELLE